VGQTQLHIFLWRISQSEIRNSAVAESEGEQQNAPDFEKSMKWSG